MRLQTFLETVSRWSPAWAKTAEVVGYLAGLATQIVELLFSTLAGTVISNVFAAMPKTDLVSVLVLVALFL